jgi:hypothetical protein
MGDQSTFNIHHGGPRGNFVGFYDSDDLFRLQTLKVPIDTTSKTELTRWLRLHYRYCTEDSFANMVENWTDFEVPTFALQIRLDAHFAPPVWSIDQLRGASVNNMQRWV